ncbi:phospholipase B1, membrane-associated-like [Engraulis encrasicolus]|uniref:phospholipase B1, membrane-associated-like n=1 Tax=Engraulis encrasicolus TaxID=184585 RepID=UPI002FD1FE2D
MFQEYREPGVDARKRTVFQCTDMSPSDSVPTSVERVKAADIKVIAALGDSITSGVAINASSIAEVFVEYRYLSWSIGGLGTFQNAVTLGNIVKLFNPDLLGPSPAITIVGQPSTLQQTGFNLAVSGANALNLTGQTRNMIDTFKSYSGLNFTDDWKLVTVFIGLNDICDYCKDKTLFSADNFISHINESLQIMMDEVPRLIVNVVQLLTIEPLRQVKEPTAACQLQSVFCSCLVLPEDNSTELTELVELNSQFQTKLEELIQSGRFFKDDFAVVLQPYLANTELPKFPNGTVDFSYFAPDCFHFAAKAHEELAKGLWNNMFQPEGEKAMLTNLTDPVTLICPPQDHPYIYTRPKALSAGTQTQVLPSLVALITALTAVLLH